MAGKRARYGTGAYKSYFHNQPPFFGWTLERACGSSAISRTSRASDLADATVVHQIRTRHVGALVGRQEERRAGDLLGPSKSTDRDHAQVHVHQSLALFGGRRLRVVGCMARNAHDVHGRRDQYDRSTTGHQRQQLLHEEDGGAGVEIECLVEMVRSERVDRSLLRQARVRHDDVDDALFGPYCRGDTVEVTEIRDISLNGRYILPDQRYRLIQLRLPTPGNKDVDPFLYEALGCGKADSTIAASDYS